MIRGPNPSSLASSAFMAIKVSNGMADAPVQLGRSCGDRCWCNTRTEASHDCERAPHQGGHTRKLVVSFCWAKRSSLEIVAPLTKHVRAKDGEVGFEPTVEAPTPFSRPACSTRSSTSAMQPSDPQRGKCFAILFLIEQRIEYEEGAEIRMLLFWIPMIDHC